VLAAAAVVAPLAGCERETRPATSAPSALSISAPPQSPPPEASAREAAGRDPRTLVTIQADGGFTASIAGVPACRRAEISECTAELAKRDPAIAELTLRAEPSVTYQSVVDVIEALKPAGVAILFDAPPGAQLATCDTHRATGAGAPSEGPELVVLVSRTHIVVADKVALTVPAFSPEGIPAEHKRCGVNDAFIVPLAKLLPATTEPRGIVVAADRDTPYRVLWEVIHTVQLTLPGRVQLLTTRRAN
jgi:biopolymer transport protein ExbD